MPLVSSMVVISLQFSTVVQLLATLRNRGQVNSVGTYASMERIWVDSLNESAGSHGKSETREH